MASRLGWLALFMLAGAGGLLFLADRFPGALGAQNEQIRLVHGVGLLALIGGSMVLGWRDSVGLAIKQALIWLGIAITVATVYSYRAEFTELGYRVAGELVPSMPMATREDTSTKPDSRNGAVFLRAGQGGHFHADMAVNGTHVRFLVDTGASSIALSAFDAQRLGIDLDTLNFNIPVQTANGTNYVARQILEEVSVGSITRQNVRAVVAREGLTDSLLGMSFLNRLGSFEMGDGVLILRD